MRRAFWLALLVCLLPCSTLAKKKPPLFADIPETDSVVINKADGTSLTMSQAEFETSVSDYFLGKTLVDASSGTVYVDYVDLNGKLYQWRPKSTVVSNGTLTIKHQQQSSGGKTYKYVLACIDVAVAVSSKPGDVFKESNCSLAANFMYGGLIKDQRTGDPFNLQSGTAPYLTNGKTQPDWPTEVHND